jgi:Tfp pilus assembly protein FimT
MSRTKRQAGVSLVELLIGVALLAVMLVAVAGVLKTGIMSSKFNLSLGNILAPARHAANRLSDHLRIEPVSVTSPVAGGNVTQMTYTDAPENGNTYAIYCDSATRAIVIMKNGSVTETLAAGIVQSITFLRDTETCSYSCEGLCTADNQAQSGRLTIKIVVSDGSYPGSPQRTLCFTVVMWNLTS